jgi:Tol biopolymer transport system component
VHRLVFITAVLGPAAVVAAVNAHSQRAAASKVRNGKISFWSDRAFGGRAQVFVMNPDGTRQSRLTNLFSAKRGDFSSNGKRLVFDGRARETLFDFDIFVMNADGTRLRQLTRGPERDTQASWSPDGRLVSFVRVENESAAPAIWIVGVDGSNAHRIAGGGSAVWAPDGKRLAVGGFALTLMKPDGARARTIVAGECEVGAWSRDGSRILFTRYRNGNPDVYLVRADGRRLRRLTRQPGEDYAADFSPDGRKILFSSDRSGLRQVYVMKLDGSSKRNVTRSRSNDWATSWQPVSSKGAGVGAIGLARRDRMKGAEGCCGAGPLRHGAEGPGRCHDPLDGPERRSIAVGVRHCPGGASRGGVPARGGRHRHDGPRSLEIA